MTILLRVLLNSSNTQVLNMSCECSIGELAKNLINQQIHIIYFYADKIQPLLNRLVNGKENV